MSFYRFAFVASKYFEFGGLERSMLRMAKEATKRGHTVEFITSNWQGEIPEGFKVQVIQEMAWTNHGKNNQLAKFISTADVRSSFDCIIGFRKIPGLDIYYAADPCYAEILKNQKSLIWRYTPRVINLLKQESGVFKKGLNTEILTIAHKQKDHFIKHYSTEACRFHLLPSGINRDLLVRPTEDQLEALRKELKIEPREKVVLHIGSDFKRKGLDRVIKALASLPIALQKNTRLIVVGESSPTKYRFLARWLGVSDRVLFVGGRRDIAKFYYISDLLIHPAYVENTGNIILEALYCGVPALVTANCGFSDHVAIADAGLVCPEPFEQACLNRQMEYMLTVDKRKIWEMNGKAFCQKHDIFSLVSKSVDIMEARAEKNRLSQ